MIWSRQNAAANRGLIYDWEDDVYQCPTCEHTFSTVEQYQEEHSCERAAYENKLIEQEYDEMMEWAKNRKHETAAPPVPITSIQFGSLNFAEAMAAAKTIAKVEFAQVTESHEGRTETGVANSSAVHKENKQQDNSQRLSVGLKVPEHTKLAGSSFRVFNKIEQCSWMDEQPSLVTTITTTIAGGVRPSTLEETRMWPPLIYRKKARKSPPNKLCLSTQSVDHLVKALFKVTKHKEMEFQVIGKKKSHNRVFKFKRFEHRMHTFVHLKHHDGKMHRVDCKLGAYATHILQLMACATSKTHSIKVDNLQPGSSGLVLNHKILRGKVSRQRDGMFIVRGRCDGELLEARSKFSHSVVHRMTHYSDKDISQEFFLALSKTFQQFKENNIGHTCQRDVTVAECGAVAGIVIQALFPSGKITCEKCFLLFDKQLDEATDSRESKRIANALDHLRRDHPRFTHVIKRLSQFEESRQPFNPNINAFTEIQRLIGGRTQAPFTHVNRVNEILLRGTKLSASDIGAAADNLVEVARFLKNRTENIKVGELQTFRNKISAKAFLNATLLCDNQLDKNGNFMWGERGYHAKRFFSNFFEEIDPDQGYDKYVVRRSPNCTRKLAIGNLIMSTNFEILRSKLTGECIGPEGISKMCISTRNDNYMYPCCCVTLDDGKPLLSDLKLPTKRHLVVGNTGDSKFIDLPSDLGEKMYIAKDGYCYLNIFLAMLVNVNEGDAKSFTKFVRDILVEKLGTWPSMMDVATACRMLIVLYPNVYNAEIPRILVDHKTKTMHVLDSYGSLSTGYHILKAGTATQLAEFANGDLESEMKHYAVGGEPSSQNENSMLQRLIKSIFKPRLMQAIIEEEPYMLILSIVSPRVILALNNSGAYERAIQTWITRDQSLTSMAATLATLAKKVSLAESVQLQMILISQYSEELLNTILDGVHVNQSYIVAIHYLTVKAAQYQMDESLHASGFRTTSAATYSLLEKNWESHLEASWRELTLWEKFVFTKSLLRFSRNSNTDLKPKIEVESNATYSTSIRGLLTRRKQRVVGMVSSIHAGFKRRCQEIKGRMATTMINGIRHMIPDFLHLINIMCVFSILVSIYVSIQTVIQQRREDKMKLIEYHKKLINERIERRMDLYYVTEGEGKTHKDFVEYLKKVDPELHEYIHMERKAEEVKLQQSKTDMVRLEKIIAYATLIMMAFDTERSDGLYKILNKFKGIISSTNKESIHLQSLDDTIPGLEDKNLTIDIEIDTDEALNTPLTNTTFRTWWDNQLARNNTKPHYRTEGVFKEFTRSTAAQVANEVMHSTDCDFLIRGAVGSGKSTGLPYHLSKKAAVLVLEPTRPLANNVHKQLQSDPFFLKPTLRMRGKSTFGSTPITIMTTGFALHYFAHNIQDLHNYGVVMFDECHVSDASAIAMRNLLHEYSFDGKVLKVSATPPGREVEFTTQFPVHLKVEDNLSFAEFVRAQGTGSNSDVIQHGDNILVYVASYNEVDTLSKMLTDNKHKVTKIDGRTMKDNNTEIQTYGNSKVKHFIVATNIIENGVTLDIDCVVDFGVKVMPVLDIDNRAVSYVKTNVSYGERIQRLGRVGRHKQGFALRIGTTTKDLPQIPEMIATEAAFFCFMYNLPVTTQSVSLSNLEKCTVRQAKTMSQFELSIFYTIQFVRGDGTMHPAIHTILSKYKLHDSETILNKLAIPNASVSQWLTAEEYARRGYRNSLENMRIAFMIKDIPERVHMDIWEAVVRHKHDAGVGRLTSMQTAKIAYTLQTDIHSIGRSLNIIEQLIANEMKKKAHCEAALSNSCDYRTFSLDSIMGALRARYSSKHTAANIEILERAKNQILEFANLTSDKSVEELLKDYGYMEVIGLQSKREVSRCLKLEGHWNYTMLAKDLLLSGAVAVGGVCMLWSCFRSSMSEEIALQGRKNQKHKLKMRQERDSRVHYEVSADPDSIEHYFGSAYNNKGKKKGTVRGMGHKNRRFVNMYGYDPTDYSFVRFVDPLTGATMDESVYADIGLVQEAIGKARQESIADGELEAQLIVHKPGIRAYYVNDATKKALLVDLTPHRSMRASDKTTTIMGFPERENELRQTGPARVIDIGDVPKLEEEIKLEGVSLSRGVRDYNAISSMVCRVTNDSGSSSTTMYGIGYGCYIITNKHLFRENNGRLLITSHHGEYICKNSASLKLSLVPGRDMLLIRLPKDCPPFPSKLKFREPTSEEKAVLVVTNFQEKHLSSMVSESSCVVQREDSPIWRHWISTKDGHCGAPIVSIRDGYIIGSHCGENPMTSNFFTSIPKDFQNLLNGKEANEWVSGWKYNIDAVCWGGLSVVNDAPSEPFITAKVVSALDTEGIKVQAVESKWMLNALNGNLRPVASCPSQLVTKHVVKGKCPLFDLYLSTHPQAKEYFTPLMGAYKPSRLNREAYIKDIMKYSTPIAIGDVDIAIFNEAFATLVQMLKSKGFEKNVYVTDEVDIFASLNMKSAVGALYKGKKRDFFLDASAEQMETYLRESCKRLYMGRKGVWNGSLKAELRPLEKVEQNKTRTFTAAPIDTLLAAKVCVDDFNNQFYSLNLNAPWTVGMTKFYMGWNTLMEKLPEGWVYCDADGSQFDSSLSPFLINAILKLRLEFMEQWDVGEQMLANLYTEIVYTPISTPDGTVIKKHKGNNSGQPSTVVDNTLMVILAMYYTMEKALVPLDKCVFFVNGDDLLIAIHPDYEAKLDEFQEAFVALGLKYEFDSRTKQKEDLWFMSHKAIKVDGIYIPKLEEERIVSILEWDRSAEPTHRLEAICASMIEAWGYPQLVDEIREFYAWTLEQAPYKQLAENGKAPYIAETALRRLYTCVEATNDELLEYLREMIDQTDGMKYEEIHLQGDKEVNAGNQSENNQKDKKQANAVLQTSPPTPQPKGNASSSIVDTSGNNEIERDVNAGTNGTFNIPRLKRLTKKMQIPKSKGRIVVNLEHLLDYKPEQYDLSNTRATHQQFDRWYAAVKSEYEATDEQMSIILNGLMVWCVENGTSPNINGVWVMMDGDEQVEYPLKPIIENAQPTFRQIMAHFSNLAEAYIELRNQSSPYMPRYGLQRNLTDMSLARFAFDFYELTSKTPVKAREAHMQMKAAAVRNTSTKLFGLDGNVGLAEEDTERHTVHDVNRNMHSLLGMRQ
ncbi:polyprotein [Sunflower mild mosaic virus]|uniref:Genome polyprotein n=1 Tax=Sunflower mild mosaic virus TaxID=715480 RepID=M9NYB7_9POTV|nr:polyprotein [Sunflower mild mosaic virus]AFU72533.1 polyprotein [Sunflower mild mosaic virus]